MKTRFGIAGIVVMAIGLVGCRSLTCDAPPSYGSDESIPPLQVPAGLEPPDTRNALKIPELNEPERPRSEANRCLDEPPPYFPNRRVGEAPAETKQ